MRYLIIGMLCMVFYPPQLFAEDSFEKIDSLMLYANYHQADSICLANIEINKESKNWDQLFKYRNKLCESYYERHMHKEGKAVVGQNTPLLNRVDLPDELITYYMYSGLYYDRLKIYDTARVLFKKALSIYKSLRNQDKLIGSNIYNYIAYTYFQDRIGDSASYYIDKALHFLDGEPIYYSKMAADIYFDIGFQFERYKQDLQSKIKYYLLGARVSEKVYSVPHPKLISAYNNIGYLYKLMGDLEKSERCFRKALDDLKELFVLDTVFQFVHAYAGLAHNYYLKNEYNNSIKYFKRAKGIIVSIYGENAIDQFPYLLRIARCYLKSEKYDSAIQYYDYAQKFTNVSRGKRLTFDYSSLAYCYEMQGDITKAHKFYLLAYHNLIQFNGRPNTRRVPASCRYIAEYYMRRHQWDSSFIYIQKALYYNKKDFTDRLSVHFNDISNNPKGFSNNIDHLQHIKTLKSKAKILTQYYKENPQKIDVLKNSLKTCQLALAFIDKMRHTYTSEKSKLEITKSSSEFVKYATQNTYDLYLLTKAEMYLILTFKLSEQGKAAVLYTGIHENEARKMASLPIEVAQKEDQIRKDIAKYESAINNLEAKGDQLEELKDSKNKLFELQNEYDQLIKQLEQSYPTYYQLKYMFDVANLKDIQRQLSPTQKMISYIKGADQIIIFCIGNNSLNTIRVAMDEGFDQQISRLRNSLSSNYSIINHDETWTVFLQSSSALFQTLIDPISNYINEDDHLIIAPDDNLSLVPFEVLFKNIDEKNLSNHKLDYLINHYAISYVNSASIWVKIKYKPQYKNNGKLLAFAPSFTSVTEQERSYVLEDEYTQERSELEPLKFANMEIKNISAYFQAQIYEGIEATESVFKKMAPSFNMIHIATHGNVQDSKPLFSRIFFTKTQKDTLEDDALHTFELYNLQLKAELAVLSACNTGFGRTIKGEGMINLARGFIYSGCKSIVMSLWNANDRTTSEIMEQFYKYLAEGKNKAQALRLAKIAYLKNADPIKAHPYFWAQFIASGDMKALVKKKTSSIWYIISASITILLIILVIIVLRKKIRNKV